MGLNFDLKSAKIFQAVRWGNHPLFRFAQSFKTLFLILFILCSFIFTYGFFTEAFTQKVQAQSLGLSILFLTLATFSCLKTTFLNSKLKNPRLRSAGLEEQAGLLSDAVSNPEKYNLAEFLNFETAEAVSKSEKSSTNLLYHLICDNPELNFLFYRALINVEEIKKTLRDGLKTVMSDENFQNMILESLKIAQKKNHQNIEAGDMITALTKCDPVFKKILIDYNLKIDDIENLTWWTEDLKKRIRERKKFWEWKNLIKKGSLAKEWTAGYTINLDKFSVSLSEAVRRRHFPEVIGHKKEIEAMERILAGREINNVLMIGEPGSGRKSMIQDLTVKSMLGESLPEVNFKRFVQLDLSSLTAQTENQEEAESLLDMIFREALTAGNIILVIDEFHNFVRQTPRPGTIDISGIISPYLALPQFQIIAITTFDEFHKSIEQNPSLLSLFETVEVSEISERETLILLEDLALKLENKYKKFVSYPALRDIINYCGKYIPAIPFPEKAMDLLGEIMIYVSRSKEKTVLPKHVAKIVSEKIKIPVGEIEAKEKEILLNLDNLIHQRIINQEEAVKEVASALGRARVGVTARKGPIGCFLFLGPTGVGKTETSKALAEIYFGSEEKMIRLDMSEFQSVSDIPRLIGSIGEDGLLTTEIRRNPFSLILLDEIEKAHPNILNLFLQVLDEGHLTDGYGRKVDFKNSIIIATSNAGYQIILEAIKLRTEWSQVKEKLLDYLFEKAIFRPEFINRFDAVVVFWPLTKENLLAITDLLLQKLKKHLDGKDIEFIITPLLIEKIVELGYNPTFGARQIRRVIQDKVENALAKGILSGELKRGNKVEIDPIEFKLKINP